jgi:hypothetical protein
VSGDVMFKMFALALIASFTPVGPSLSAEEKCLLRAGNFNLNPNVHFAGMFRIPLNPPDFGDSAAVQRHMVLSRTWADLTSAALSAKTGGLCGAFIHFGEFPNLHVSLIVRRTASQIDREKLVCTHALEDILQNSQPNGQQIKQITKRNARFQQPPQPDPETGQLEPVLDAANIVHAALPQIYEKNSILHALTSVDWTALGTVDAVDLRAWINSQRSPQRLLLESIPHCLQRRGDLASSHVAPRERSETAILPAGKIDVSRIPGGSLPAGPLRYAVIVGDPDQPPSLAVLSEIETRYCSRVHSFSIGDGASPHVSVTVQPRCQGTGVSDLDSWTMIYCDPADCTSASVEKAVMAAIASDPEILDFARRSSDTATPRGPYLVTVK